MPPEIVAADCGRRAGGHGATSPTEGSTGVRSRRMAVLATATILAIASAILFEQIRDRSEAPARVEESYPIWTSAESLLADAPVIVVGTMIDQQSETRWLSVEGAVVKGSADADRYELALYHISVEAALKDAAPQKLLVINAAHIAVPTRNGVPKYELVNEQPAFLPGSRVVMFLQYAPSIFGDGYVAAGEPWVAAVGSDGRLDFFVSPKLSRETPDGKLPPDFGELTVASLPSAIAAALAAPRPAAPTTYLVHAQAAAALTQLIEEIAPGMSVDRVRARLAELGLVEAAAADQNLCKKLRSLLADRGYAAAAPACER